MAHSAPSKADMAFLEALTSDSNSSSMGPLGGHSHPDAESAQQGAQTKKQLPRRESHMDALMISAVLAGSGPLTRHHFGHANPRPGAYASCDESRPSSPSRQPLPSKVIMRSTQAPRSQRLRIEQENQERQHAFADRNGESSTSALKIPSPTSPTEFSASSQARSMGSASLATSVASKDRPKRRMSVDPGPLSALLQAAGPTLRPFNPSANSLSPSPAASRPPVSNARAQVRCMARTRVPTPHGEIFLHLYHNNQDKKEHLAIVYDPIQLSAESARAAPKGRREIRSHSLNEVWRDGETDMERVVRGAYVGRLNPGSEDQASVPIRPKPNTIEEEDVLDRMTIDDDSEEDILPMVRIHSECFTGETIGSMRCDCGEQLDEAMRLISVSQQLNQRHGLLPTPGDSRSPSPTPTTLFSSMYNSKSFKSVPGRGVVIYMRQEGRGIGLLEKIRAYNLQDLGHDTVTANLMLGHGADERKYDVAAEILRDLGLAGPHGEGIRLLTNNPEKVEGLAKEGVKIVERVGMVPRDWKCRDSPRKGSGGTSNAGDEEEYEHWRERRAGVGLIGAGTTKSVELEKYLRTKVERMGHLIDIPHDS